MTFLRTLLAPNEPDMREVRLMTDWGYELFYECTECGAVVRNASTHMEYHRGWYPFRTLLAYWKRWNQVL